MEGKHKMIEPMNPEIPVYRQYELTGLTRSSYYYKTVKEREHNLRLMRLIDEQWYTKAPLRREENGGLLRERA